MSGQNYRYYCLDSTGQLHSAEWFEADSIEAAIAHVQTLHPDGLCEIWQGHRLIAKLSPKHVQA